MFKPGFLVYLSILISTKNQKLSYKQEFQNKFNILILNFLDHKKSWQSYVFDSALIYLAYLRYLLSTGYIISISCYPNQFGSMFTATNLVSKEK